MKKELGKLFLDLAKILFGTSFLGAVISESTNKMMLGVISAIAVCLLIFTGLIIIKKSEK